MYILEETNLLNVKLIDTSMDLNVKILPRGDREDWLPN